MSFGRFVERQWTVLALPNFKASTQHGYKIVLRAHVLPAWSAYRLRGRVGRLVRNSWTLLSSILESAVEFGYLQANPARGTKFPQKALKSGGHDHRRHGFRETALGWTNRTRPW